MKNGFLTRRKKKVNSTDDTAKESIIESTIMFTYVFERIFMFASLNESYSLLKREGNCLSDRM